MAGNFVDSLVIGIGLDTKGVAKGVQEVGRTIDSGLKGAFDNAVKGVSPLGEALKSLRKDAENLQKPVDATAEALKDFGVRTEAQIRALMEKVKVDMAQALNDPRLTDRDKMLVWEKAKAQLEGYEKELKTGLPAAAQQGFAGAEAAVGKFKGFLSSMWAQISGPLMGAFAIGGSVSSFISNSMSAGELAEKLKVDVEEIQIWSGAMDRAGGSASGLQSTIEKLNASGKANGDVFGTLMGLAEKAEHMSKEAFVEHAKRLEIDEKTIEVLAQGKKALEAHLKRQEELGVYTKEDAEQSKKFKQGLADLLQAWDGLTSFIGRFAVPVMSAVAGVLTSIVANLRRHTPVVVAAIGAVGAALAFKLMPPLKELPKLVAGVSRAFLRWLPFVAIIAGIALLVDDLYAYVSGGKSAFAEFWSIFGTGEEISQNLTAAWKELKEIGLALFAGVAAAAKGLWKVLGDWGVLDGLKNVLMGFGHFIKGLFTKDIGTAWKGLVQQFSGLGAILTAPVRAASAAVKKAVTDAWNDASATVSGALDKLWTTITNWATKLWADFKKSAVDAVTHLFDGIKLPSLSDILGGAGDVAGSAADLVKGGLGTVGDFFGGMFRDAEPETAKAGAKVQDGMAKTAGEVEGGFKAAWTKASGAAVSLFGGAANEIRSIFGGVFAELQAQAQSMVAGARAMAGGGAMVPAFAGIRAQNAGARNVSQSSNVHIGTMNVQTRATNADGVARGMQGALNRNRLVQPAASGVNTK